MLGEAKVKIGATLQPLKTALAAARKLTVRSLSSLGKSVVSGMTSVVKSAMRTLITSVKWAVAGITAAMVAIGISSARMAADVEESENLFVVSMGNMVDAARMWSESFANAVGMNAYEARKMVGVFNVMLKSMGIGAIEAFKMSRNMTQLAFDMASFFNLKPEEAFQKLQAGITGEIEPLKRLGIIINETAIKNFALSEGMIRQGQVMTELQKIQARYNLIMVSTRDAQGDMLRTMNSTENVSRRLGSAFDRVRVIIGNQLNPVINMIKKDLTAFLTANQPQIEAWANVAATQLARVWLWFKEVLAVAQSEGWSTAFKKIADDIGPPLKKILDKLIEITKEFGKKLFDFALEAFIKLLPVAKELGIEVVKGIKEGLGNLGFKGKGGIVAGSAAVGALKGGTIAGPPGAAVGAIIGGELSSRATGLPSPSALFASPANFGVEMMKLAAAMERNANALEKQNEVK